MHQVIRDAFENYGYIDLDTTEPRDKSLVKFMKDHFIIRKLLTHSQTGWPEFRYMGPKVWLIKMTKEHWDDDLEEYFKKDGRLNSFD